jgi:hypothetical protein
MKYVRDTSSSPLFMEQNFSILKIKIKSVLETSTGIVFFSWVVQQRAVEEVTSVTHSGEKQVKFRSRSRT